MPVTEKKKKINSKSKGNRVELELSKILTERFNKEFKRVPMSGGWATYNKNSNIREDALEILAGDIMCPPEFKFSIESKGRQDFNFWNLLNEDTIHLEIDDWIYQAEQDSKIKHTFPLIYVKVDRRKPFVLFPKKLYEGKITYGDYTILRFDYFLQFEDSFFFKE